MGLNTITMLGRVILFTADYKKQGGMNVTLVMSQVIHRLVM